MLQYGKPINKNIKSCDLKIECLCLSSVMASAFARLFTGFRRGPWYALPKA
jgi:hypothetical protein